ncbi:hypothetical protein AAGS61_17445 [Lysinibacillus sp. KU-BSD001]|uniref:hypothetical protein n=1 Tax=Lysinibacillus sp. KU-BSD001 TaxID=3141328 RepID=UPI0036EE0905
MQALQYINFKENEIRIPYYSFKYIGFKNSDLKMRAQSTRNDRQRIAKLEKSTLREWFFNETHKQLDRTADYFRFSKAICIIIHHFSTKRATDLDNYDYKYVIDAVKSLQIIEDDSFHYLDLYTSGVQGEVDMLECYLIPSGYLSKFVDSNVIPKLQQQPAQIIRMNEEILKIARARLLDESKFF